MLGNPDNSNEVICYEYIGAEGELELLVLDPAGIPVQKSKIQTLQGLKPPTKNDIIVTKMIRQGPTASMFEYCFFIQREDIVHEAFSKFTDEDWYDLYEEIEGDIPLSSKEFTVH